MGGKQRAGMRVRARHAASGRRGVIAELLVVIVVLASVGLIISQFHGRRETPSVQKATLPTLKDLHDTLAQAVLNWLKAGPFDQPLACNGVYTAPFNESSLAGTLSPFIQDQLATLSGEGVDLVDIRAGDLASISLEDGGIGITLTNGSVVYNDSTIYSENDFDQEYFFDVRLPLALKVVHDWELCDAGNLSQHIAESFGSECFFGKKDQSYPGGCPTSKYNIVDADKQAMLARAPTYETLSKGVAASVDTLNAEFGGGPTCQMARLAQDAGITCTFSLENVGFEYDILPYSSEMLPKEFYTRADVLEVEAFRRDDSHVWALPANITIGGYDDTELSCSAGDREPAMGAINNPIEVEADAENLVTASGRADASPVLYVNTTRGATFDLVLRCRDERTTLLGQPIEYVFRSRHGVRMHCGPREQQNGAYMCSGCGLKPGLNLDHCVTPTLPDNPFAPCTKAMTWWLVYGLDDSPYQAYDTFDDTITNNGEPFMDLINQSCGTVYGHVDEYPLPPASSDEYVALRTKAGTVLCCGTPGYNYTCDPTWTMTNTACLFNQAEYTGMCTSPVNCGENTEWNVGDRCIVPVCDATENQCVIPSADDGEIAYGDPCNHGDSCYRCGEDDGICKLDPEMLGESCGQSTDCKEYECTENGCEPVPVNEGDECTTSNVCSDAHCDANGNCRDDTPKNEGQWCGTAKIGGCWYQKSCQNGLCRIDSSVDPECTDQPPASDCEPPCQAQDDGSCVC